LPDYDGEPMRFVITGEMIKNSCVGVLLEQITGDQRESA